MTHVGMDNTVADVVNRTLVDEEQSYPPMFKMIYLLRHSVTHLAYMREELHRRGYKLPAYSKSCCPKT